MFISPASVYLIALEIMLLITSFMCTSSPITFSGILFDISTFNLTGLSPILTEFILIKVFNASLKSYGDSIISTSEVSILFISKMFPIISRRLFDALTI